ncbi:MAG: DinB family protein [Algisphaera sp.]
MALKDEITTYQFWKQYGESLLQNVDVDNAWKRLSGEGSHNPAWIMGHLAWVANMLVEGFGETSQIDMKAWGERFGMGSNSTDDADGGPSWDELLAAWREGHDAVVAHVGNVTAEILAAPNPFEALRGSFPTTGEFFSFLLSGHESLHLGQLSAWRRAQGESPLF